MSTLNIPADLSEQERANVDKLLTALQEVKSAGAFDELQASLLGLLENTTTLGDLSGNQADALAGWIMSRATPELLAHPLWKLLDALYGYNNAYVMRDSNGEPTIIDHSCLVHEDLEGMSVLERRSAEEALVWYDEIGHVSSMPTEADPWWAIENVKVLGITLD